MDLLHFSKGYQPHIELLIELLCNKEVQKEVVEAKLNLREGTNIPNQESEAALNNLGYFLTSDVGIITVSRELSRGIPGSIFDRVIFELEQNLCVTSLTSPYFSNDKMYKITEFGIFLFHKDCLLNVIFGFKYMIEKYASALVKIEVESSMGDLSIGTGFVFKCHDANIDKEYAIVITNRHVLENNIIRLFDRNNLPIIQNRIMLSEFEDIGIVEVDSSSILCHLHTLEEVGILDDIITMGYPRVPQTTDTPLLVHKGEVNSFVEEFSGKSRFILSSKTGPGNSGGLS